MSYELVAVARVPQASGPPTLSEVGPIVAPQITWTAEVSRPGSIAFSCVPDRLPAEVRSRLLNLAQFPTEVWLRRSGTIVAAGFLAGYQVQGGTLSCTAPGLLGYLAYMMVDADLAYSNQDQTSVIGKGLVDQWQNLPYGHFGITTSGIAASGVLRDRTYIAAEQHQVLQRLLELGDSSNGFDVAVNPSTRALLLAAQGVDRSGSVHLDARNITDPGVVVSVSPGDLASEAYGLGTGGAAPIVSKQSNTTVRSQFGRSAVAGSYDGVTVQATLDAHTARLLDDRDQQLFLPGPGLHPVAEVDVTSFDAGDLVSYSFDAGVGLQSGVFRVASKQVTVDEQGGESIKVSFG